MLGENTTAGWRTELWVRCDGMGEGLRRRYAAQRALSASDLEDVWSAMLARVTQAPGPNRLPGDAETWGDARLRSWLDTTFRHEIGRAAQRNLTADGLLRSASIEDVSDHAHSRGVISRDAAPAGPETEVFQRLDASDYVRGIEDVAGPEAVRLMLADAIGASSVEQRRLLGITTRSPFETLRGRLEIAGHAMSRRVQAVVLWFLPNSLLRWLTLAGGPVPRIGAVGLVLAAVAAGGAGVTTAHHRAARPTRALTPVVSRIAGKQLQATRTPLVAIATRQHSVERAAAAKVTARRRPRQPRRRLRPPITSSRHTASRPRQRQLACRRFEQSLRSRAAIDPMPTTSLALAASWRVAASIAAGGTPLLR